MSGLRLTYAEPPASFELQGQKVCTPGQPVEGGLATCLDTALLFAAALEQTGLYPVLVPTEGHALSGIWLQPQEFATLLVPDAAPPSADEAMIDPADDALEAAPPLPPFGIADPQMAPTTPEGRLDRWQRKLLDLTTRNRLLHVKAGNTAIRLVCPDPAALEDQLASGENFRIVAKSILPALHGATRRCTLNAPAWCWTTPMPKPRWSGANCCHPAIRPS